MRSLRALIAAAALVLPGIAVAQAPAATTVTSAAPDSVAVTIYRSPDSRALDLNWLQGYALITETRRVAIPAGRAVIRFEGVAGRMLPESAIVTGLPAGVREKNLDADLLNPRSLYDRALGRPVTIRRVLDGKTVEERAIIRSGPDGAAILQTKEGFIAANCGPGKDGIVYDSVPPGLSARPTLSVQTDSPAASEVTLTLSYLAWGFDWQANYVATLRPDGKSADLFAWVTLANGDVTSFPAAETMVVAGKVEQNGDPGDTVRRDGDLVMQCFYQDVTVVDALPVMEPMALPAPAPMEIVVTARRAESLQRIAAVTVVQEELGDLKLYRVPHPTDVASMRMKQVALLARESVPVDIVYRHDEIDDAPRPARILLRAQNRKEKGLGLPLPAGGVAVFEPQGGTPLLLGEGTIGNRAVNEEVEIPFATSPAVLAMLEPGAKPKGPGRVRITNANARTIRYELVFREGRWTGAKGSKIRRNGEDLWALDIPANGTATLTLR